MNAFSERVPPQNLEAEQSVLGAMLIDREAVIAVSNKLVPEDFYSDKHQQLFASMLAIYNRGEPIDPITVQDELNNGGHLEAVGGLTYLTSLINLVPTTANVLQYAEIVEEKATLRRLQTAARRIVDDCYTTEDLEATLQDAEKAVFAVTHRRSAKGYLHIRDALVTAYEHLENLYTSKGKTTGVPAGFRDLDGMTSGFQPSDLIIIAARPSVGKTAFTLNVARNAAVDGKKTVVFFSLEMAAEQLAMRLLASEAAVDGHKLRTGQLQDQDWTRLGTALSKLADANLYIDDTPNCPLPEMRAKARRISQEHGLDMIIIDYLQLMSIPQRPGAQANRQQEISEISRSLKALARELKVPVIALSQLSRSVEQRQDKRPMLSDLRECLTGDTLVALASGELCPIANLVGQQPEVVTLDDWNMAVRRASRVWKVGERPVYRLTTRTGRVIRATANHPFRQLNGWAALSDLKAGDRIAIPRTYPDTTGLDWEDERFILLAHLIGDGSYLPRQPLRYTSSSDENLQAVTEAAWKIFGIEAKPSRVPGANVRLLSAGANRWHPNPLAVWLGELGIWGQRSHEKRIPEQVLGANCRQIGLFLRHLWATDGCVNVRKKGGHVSIYYATNSAELAKQVQHLLARLGIYSIIHKTRKGEYRPGYHVQVPGSENQLIFARLVGGYGPRVPHLEQACTTLATVKSNPNVDTVPKEIWRDVRHCMQEQSISQREMARMRGTAYGGTSHFRFAPSRSVLSSYAELLSDTDLKAVAEADVYWDEVDSIEPDGDAEVFDMAVPGTNNFVANGIVVHNSGAIEQDADMVAFLYREDYYDQNTEKKDMVEIIVAKHRNGPVGSVELFFMKDIQKMLGLEHKR